MKPAPFTYAAPSTVEEAITLLAEHGDTAKLLAGGQSLMPLMNLRLARPQYIIDLNRIAGLDSIQERDGALVVGTMTRQRSVSNACPLCGNTSPCCLRPQRSSATSRSVTGARWGGVSPTPTPRLNCRQSC